MTHAVTPTRAGLVRPKLDQICADAVDLARDAVTEDVAGAYIEAVAEGERLVTHYFECTMIGYRGWRWAVTVARVSRSKQVTICETVLLPGPDALTTPDWVPWNERVQPGDLGVGDLMPTGADDDRLVPGYLLSEDPAVDDVVWELGLGRTRVMSREGRLDAAERWYEGEQGPQAPIALGAPANARCVSCGFYLPLAGSMRALFGACANLYAPDDGRVVSADHGCGAHSEVLIEQTVEIDEAPTIYDDAEVEPVVVAPAAPIEAAVETEVAPVAVVGDVETVPDDVSIEAPRDDAAETVPGFESVAEFVPAETVLDRAADVEVAAEAGPSFVEDVEPVEAVAETVTEPVGNVEPIQTLAESIVDVDTAYADGETAPEVSVDVEPIEPVTEPVDQIETAGDVDSVGDLDPETGGDVESVGDSESDDSYADVAPEFAGNGEVIDAVTDVDRADPVADTLWSDAGDVVEPAQDAEAAEPDGADVTGEPVHVSSWEPIGEQAPEAFAADEQPVDEHADDENAPNIERAADEQDVDNEQHADIARTVDERDIDTEDADAAERADAANADADASNAANADADASNAANAAANADADDAVERAIVEETEEQAVNEPELESLVEAVHVETADDGVVSEPSADVESREPSASGDADDLSVVVVEPAGGELFEPVMVEPAGGELPEPIAVDAESSMPDEQIVDAESSMPEESVPEESVPEESIVEAPGDFDLGSDVPPVHEGEAADALAAAETFEEPAAAQMPAEPKSIEFPSDEAEPDAEDDVYPEAPRAFDLGSDLSPTENPETI